MPDSRIEESNCRLHLLFETGKLIHNFSARDALCRAHSNFVGHELRKARVAVANFAHVIGNWNVHP